MVMIIIYTSIMNTIVRLYFLLIWHRFHVMLPMCRHRQVAKGSELWMLNAVPATERLKKLDDEGTRWELMPTKLVMR
jgi:hypothetical protein